MTFRREFPLGKVDVAASVDGLECGMPTKTAKEEVRAVLDELPDEASMDEIVDRLQLRQLLLRRIAQTGDGEIVSHEEAMKRLGRWQSSSGT